jgi:hypothetical protein
VEFLGTICNRKEIMGTEKVYRGSKVVLKIKKRGGERMVRRLSEEQEQRLFDIYYAERLDFFKNRTLPAILYNEFAPSYGWTGVNSSREYLDLIRLIYSDDERRFYQMLRKYRIDEDDLPRSIRELAYVIGPEVEKDIKRGRIDIEELFLKFFDYNDLIIDFENWLEELDDDEIEEYLSRWERMFGRRRGK